MNLAEIMAESARLNEAVKKKVQEVEAAEAEAQAFLVDKLGIDPKGSVTIGAVVRLIEKVLDHREAK